jgi:hypothetical protein
MLTPRDIAILVALTHYYCLSRAQIQRLCFPDDPNGRITRRRLHVLLQAQFIARHTLFPYNPLLGAPAPVYYPSRKGAEFLAAHFDDERYLTTCTQPPQPNNILHWLAVTDTHIALVETLARQQDVKLEGWLNEWDVANKEETRPEKRYRLYTLLRQQPRLVCAPDAAFLLSKNEFRKVYYLEQDRGTSGVHQIAASKTPGYAIMADQNLHHRHFPETNIDPFTILLVTMNANRREALRKAFRGKPGAALWRFATVTDLNAETFLHGPVFYPCDGEPASLVRRAVPS